MIGCYFTNWSQHRKDEGKFLPKHIDPHLCTHAYFAFANIDVDKMRLAPFENNDMNSTSKSPVNMLLQDHFEILFPNLIFICSFYSL